MNMDDYNYYSDHRVRAGESSKWYHSITKDRNFAFVDIQDWIEDWIESGHPLVEELSFNENGHVKVPLAWEVCPTCNGKGTHVNPSIDCGGLSSDSFADDPDFEDSYFSGVYDVQCYGCCGDRVLPFCADEEVNKILDEKAEEEAYHQSERDAERRMGA